MDLKKRAKSFGYAGRGIWLVIKEEIHIKIHLVIMLLVIIAGIVFCISPIEWMICLLCFGMVISAEMFNSAIENIVNMVSPDLHPLAGKIKDIAAGAVLIVAVFSAIVGLIIFLPKVWILVQFLFQFL